MSSAAPASPYSWLGELTANSYKYRGIYRLDDTRIVATDGTAFVVVVSDETAPTIECAEAIARHIGFEVEKEAVIEFRRLTDWLAALSPLAVDAGTVFGRRINRHLVKRFVGPLQAKEVMVQYRGFEQAIAFLDVDERWGVYAMPIVERRDPLGGLELGPVPELIK
ncbi:MAG TPA: hypothetical protein VFQ35_25305 [Polyangiaceae bacterium]|nr:hypothetical protein [Polyangiaceae bacterium]